MNNHKYKCVIIFLFVLIFCSSSFGQMLDKLTYYMEIAGKNNPALRAAFHVYEATLQKVPQATKTFQDPQLNVGFFLEPMEIVSGKQVAQFQIMQMFSWFGTTKAIRTEAEHMAKMAFEEFREARDQLFFDVYVEWFTLCRLQQQLNNNQENKELLLQLEELALKKFASPNSAISGSTYPKTETPSTTGNMQEMSGGGTMKGMNIGNTTVTQSGQSSMPMQGNMSQMGSSSGMADLLSIRLEIAELDNNIENIQSQIEVEKVRFNALLNRPSSTEIMIPDYSLEQIPFSLDMEKSMQSIRTQNPMLGMITQEEATFKAKIEMDKKMSYPMFGVGLQYMLINKKPETDHNTMNSMNGKDMFMPMLSMSIPIFRNKYNAQQRESELLQKASREKYNNTLNMLEAELHNTKNQLDNAKRKIILYGTQSELVRTTLKLMLQEFSSGKGDLSSVIRTQRQLLNYLLKKEEAIIDYNMMVANVKKLISISDK